MVISINFREGIDAKEDPEYGLLFSLSGTLKIIAMCRNDLDNELWYNFCESLSYDKYRKVIFNPNIELIESLIKLKYNSRFTAFYPIINIINDRPQLLFDSFDNTKLLLELCEAYGREFGLLNSIPQECKQQKDLIFVAKFIYYGLICKI